MYFSRISFNPMAQTLANTLCKNTYREHQALWRLFDSDPEAKRDFLYRQTLENGRIKYYVLSKREPVDKDNLWLIDPPKSYDPKLVEGQRLFFTLRANPVVTVKNAQGKSTRHDVVIHQKKQLGQNVKGEKPKYQEYQLIQDTCLEWLSKRASANGFEFNPQNVRVEAYQQHTAHASTKNHPIKYSSVDFEGELTVTEPEKFKQALWNGVGKSKAFGCGLLLVRKIYQT